MKERTITTRVNPNEADGLDSIISQSYDNFVRLERRNLLASSSVMLISYFGGANPTQIHFPYIELPNMSTSMLFTSLLLICLYFLVAFIIYAYPSFRATKKSWKELTSKTMQITSNFHRFHIEKEVFLSTSRFYSWLFVNYALPVFMGAAALTLGVCKIV
ncbi:hypothetical protein [Mariprofundus ferrooxydans]|uniref:hypothetical protein n=1 Tax=Mariprofundus ferrooxydans TaxID=314344 RepID=UPI0012DF6E4A|nr:hypothetical protein [Mariprofundus ferrooxydans]